jgi:hypothetical protein
VDARPVSDALGLVVVVPTRNRADLAVRAVRSAVEQEGPVAVIVSDNSTDLVQARALEAECDALIASSGRPLIYLRPGRDLPMSEHWEWARLRAQELRPTDHVTYLTDRTVLKPGAARRLLEIVHDHPARVITYNNDLVDDSGGKPVLRRETWSGAVTRVPSRRLLELTAALVLVRPLPRMLNTLVPAAVLERLAQTYDRVFESVAPDFCLCFRILQQESEILYLDEPLTVMHGLARSNGNSISRGVRTPDTVDFLGKARSGGGIAADTALPEVTTTYNVIVQEYLAASQHAGDVLPPLDQRAYVRTLARETDGFLPGAAKDANMAALGRAGVGFGRAARLRRSAAHVGHFLSVLGPRDFVVLSQDRVRGARSVDTFPSAEEALAAATSGAMPRSSPRRLHYLGGSSAPVPD